MMVDDALASCTRTHFLARGARAACKSTCDLLRTACARGGCSHVAVRRRVSARLREGRV